MLAAAAANLMASAVERPSSTPTMYAAVKQSPAPAGHTFNHALVKQSRTWLMAEYVAAVRQQQQAAAH
jgi:hypothetical protein